MIREHREILVNNKWYKIYFNIYTDYEVEQSPIINNGFHTGSHVIIHHSIKLSPPMLDRCITYYQVLIINDNIDWNNLGTYGAQAPLPHEIKNYCDKFIKNLIYL